MKKIKLQAILIASLLSGCEINTSDSVPAAPAKNNQIAIETKDAKVMDVKNLLPNNYLKMNQAAMPNGGLCVVGAELSEEGAESAGLFLIDPELKKINREAKFETPQDMFQSRATHCVCDNDKCYVLLASDTHSEQSLSQTLLSVISLSSNDGTILVNRSLMTIPKIEEATTKSVSTWVEPDHKNFVLMGNALSIHGKYREIDSDSEHAFSISIDAGELK